MNGTTYAYHEKSQFKMQQEQKKFTEQQPVSITFLLSHFVQCDTGFEDKNTSPTL